MREDYRIEGDSFPNCSVFLFLKQRLRELFRVEGLQVVRLLAEADEFDGQAEFLLDGHDHAAFARAVEPGHDEAGERDGLVEFARLVERVHAGAAVEHEQDFVRRAGPWGRNPPFRTEMN